MLVQQRERTTTGETWTARPRTVIAMRVIAWVGPIALSLIATVILARVFPRPDTRAGVVLWWIALSSCATAVLGIGERAGRRLLPLAALFQLSLAFPDQAPSRFRSALRTGTVRQLEQRVAQIKAEGLSNDPALAAETLIELVAALNRHDRVTRGHAERVRAYARMIGEEMGLDPDDLDRLQWAALLHDVGKLFVPAEILNKPGALTAAEYEVVKIHPAVGAELCEPLRGWLGDWVSAVGEHHERWDGLGYPNGLSGPDISMAARIVAVADVYDVITSARSYKAPCTPVEARQELARSAGSHFDPRVVRAFLSVSIGRVRGVMGPLSWLAQVPVLGQAALLPAAGMAGSGMVTAGALMLGGFVDTPRPVPVRPAVVEEVAVASDGADGVPREAGAPGGDRGHGTCRARPRHDRHHPRGRGRRCGS